MNNILTLDPLSGDSWDTMTASHLRASFFHSSSWTRVLKASYGHKPFYLGEMNANQPRTLLPIMEVNSPWKGRRGVALPFSDECGLLRFCEASWDPIIKHALELGRERGWKYLELRGDIPGDPPPPRWASFVG